jgi:uncharacterized protein (TIGR00156 family)
MRNPFKASGGCIKMNRKVLLLVTMAMLVSVLPLYGQFAGPGSAAPVIVDVKSILANPVDDTWVTLKGHILEKVGRKNYMFSDGTGQIPLEIDNKYFPSGVTITPKTLIQISGELDVEYHRSPEIDVKNIVVLPEGGAGSPSPGRFESK